MGQGDAGRLGEHNSPHLRAAEAFVHQVKSDDLPALQDLILFGSTARGTTTGLASDIDFLAVIADSTDRHALATHLRDTAYDVMLEYGPVIEVFVLTTSEFERKTEHPFI